MRTTIAALLLPLVLAGCGDDQVDASSSPVSLTDLANDMGCPNYEFDPEIVGVRSAASCELDGQEVWIYIYSTATQQEVMHELSRSGGGIWVSGDLFDVQAPTDELAQQIAEDTGGKVE